MTNKLRWIIAISLIATIAGIALLTNYFLSPHASEQSSASESTVIWGYVTDENGNPLADIRLTIGNSGAISGSAGGYIIFTNETGRLPVDFRKSLTNELFLLHESTESQVFVTAGTSNNLNFEIKKSNIQPTPIVVQPGQLPTAIPSPSAPSQAITSAPTASPSIAPKPAQPTGLSATARIRPSRIELKWKDNALGEAGYTISRTEATTALVKTFDVAADTTTYSDTSIEKGKTYFYKVRAYNGSGETKIYSAYSNEKKVTVK